jgi:hypothetical protein
VYLYTIIRNLDDTYCITEAWGVVQFDEHDSKLIESIQINDWKDVYSDIKNREELNQFFANNHLNIEDFYTVTDFAIQSGYSIEVGIEDWLSAWCNGKQMWINYYKSNWNDDEY